MALNLSGWGAVVALLVAAAAASHAAATFAASPGFSGRAGVTCIACHTEPPVLAETADAVLDGLPAAWDPGQTYTLSIAVTGGPAAMPAPAPQGGFDIAVSAGRLQLLPADADKLRLVGEQEATYRPAGTLQRGWTVEWVAPDLSDAPAPITVWLAVVAANGNHVVATNASDGGERFDAVDSLIATVDPSPPAVAAWRALPLLAPSATANRTAYGWSIDGRHADGNATRLLWRVDNGPWQGKDTAETWTLVLEGLDGSHTVALRSEGRDRSSPDVTLALDDPGFIEKVTGRKGAPLPALLPIAALALAILARRSPR